MNNRVYNIGGGRGSNCSILEAIAITLETSSRQLEWSNQKTNRTGDHIWWISDLSNFQTHYPNWRLQYDVTAIIREIYTANVDRWKKEQLTSV